MLTQIVPARLPIEQFRSELLRVCGQFDARPGVGAGVIRGAVRVDCRARLHMAHIATDLQQIVRTRRNIRHDSGENYFLIVQEEGRALMGQNGHVRMIAPGDMILVDSAQPSEFTFFGNYSRQLSLHLPRTEMRARFGEHIRGGTMLNRADQTAIAIKAVLSKAFTLSEDHVQSGYLREALFGLIGAMLYERADGDGSLAIEADVSGAQALKRAIAHIDSRFPDPELTIPGIADDLDVSMRQLQRGFALIGTTPTAYLMQKRMELACTLLMARASGGTAPLISRIAMDCGFSDISYFNRLFRKAFGCAPRQYGQGGQATYAGAGPSAR
jgi:AraC family transcriptional regulator, positive regulator of tynA and feaB